MKKFIIFCSTAAIPFIIVWIGFILTAFSYNPIEVFQNGSFWGFSVVYWFLWLCLSPMIIEIINETNSKKNTKEKTNISDEMVYQLLEKRKQAIKKHLAGYSHQLTTEEKDWVEDELSKTLHLPR